MSEEHNVSMPAHPGATVIVTGVNDNAAPAADGPAFTSPTDGTDTKAESAAWVEAYKGAVARDLNNIALVKVYKQHVQHAYGDGPVPDSVVKAQPMGDADPYAETRADIAELGAKLVDGDSLPGMDAVYQPIKQGDIEKLVNRGVVAANVPRETAGEAAQFALDAKLPAAIADGLMDRIGHHLSKGGGLGDISPEQAADLHEECARVLGGYQKAAATVDLARRYLEHAGGPRLLAYVDAKAGSLGYDAKLITALAGMARARGLDQ